MRKSKTVKLLERIKAGLETPEKGAATLTLRLTDLAVITHAVPAERVTPHLPPGLTLDRLPNAEGELVAFVQTTCAFCEDARWSPAPIGTGEAFRVITYRVLARYEKARPAVFILRSFYDTDRAFMTQRAVQKEADFARIAIHVSGDPVRGAFNGYRVRAVADRGTTEWEIASAEDESAVAAPFGQFDDMAGFLIRRESAYFTPSAAPKGWLAHAPSVFPEVLPPPKGARLVSARLTPWREMGILSTEEAANPHSVLLLPALTVTAYPPRLVKTAPKS